MWLPTTSAKAISELRRLVEAPIRRQYSDEEWAEMALAEQTSMNASVKAQLIPPLKPVWKAAQLKPKIPAQELPADMWGDMHP